METKTVLEFSEKSVYGKVLFYPQNAAAKTICEVAGRKTMKQDELKTLEKSFVIETIYQSVLDKT